MHVLKDGIRVSYLIIHEPHAVALTHHNGSLCSRLDQFALKGHYVVLPMVYFTLPTCSQRHTAIVDPGFGIV